MRGDPRRLGTIVFACVFAAQSGQIALTPVLTDLADEFDLATAAAGQIRTAAAVVAGLAALAVGLAGRRLGLRCVLGVGLALLVAGSAVGATAGSVAVLVVGQCATGASWSLLVGGGIAAAAEWTPPESRGRVVALGLIGAPVAWVIGMPAVGLAGEISWRFALALPVLPALAAALALSAAPGTSTRSAYGHLRAALRDRAVAAWTLGELLGYAGWAASLAYVGAHLVETAGASVGQAGFVLGLGAAPVHCARPRCRLGARVQRARAGAPPARRAGGRVEALCGRTLTGARGRRHSFRRLRPNVDEVTVRVDEGAHPLTPRLIGRRQQLGRACGP